MLQETSRLLKAIGSCSHIAHLNYVGSGNFLGVHQFLKSQYEQHLEQYDTAAEFVRALGADAIGTVAELHALPSGFRDLERGCSDEQMLMIYMANLQALIALAQKLEPVAARARAIDVANWCAELVAAGGKACWFLRASLGIK